MALTSVTLIMGKKREFDSSTALSSTRDLGTRPTRNLEEEAETGWDVPLKHSSDSP